MDPTSTLPPTRTRTRRWPWLVAIASLLACVLATVLYPPNETAAIWTVMISSITVVFASVGALLSVRVPGNRVGTVLLVAGATIAAATTFGVVSLVVAERGDVPPAIGALAGIANNFGYSVPLIAVLIGIPLIFPDGHLLSPRWRWIVVLAVVALTGQAFSQTFGPDPVGPNQTPNPFTIPELEPLVAALDAFASWSSIIGFGAAALAVVLRYQRGNEIERHQLKWLFAVSAVAAVALPLSFVAPPGAVSEAATLFGLVALLAVPIAIAIAILRYRLYDIDRIISRTIGWSLVSGLLVGAFAVLVVGLQAMLAGVTQQALLAGWTQGQTLAVAASTLVAFALFHPVRRTVQRAVDRRFDRSRYDAQLTVDAFAERLRDEVDLDTLAGELERTVSGAIRPTAASLWLPGRET